MLPSVHMNPPTLIPFDESKGIVVYARSDDASQRQQADPGTTFRFQVKLLDTGSGIDNTVGSSRGAWIQIKDPDSCFQPLSKGGKNK